MIFFPSFSQKIMTAFQHGMNTINVVFAWCVCFLRKWQLFVDQYLRFLKFFIKFRFPKVSKKLNLNYFFMMLQKKWNICGNIFLGENKISFINILVNWKIKFME